MKRFNMKTGLVESYLNEIYWERKVFAEKDVLPDQGYESFIIGEDDHLHFIGLEIFSRREDAVSGQKVSVFGDEIIVSEDLTGNPSRRRDAVSLYFASECGVPVRLNIIQHKGTTYAKFEVWDGKKPKI